MISNIKHAVRAVVFVCGSSLLVACDVTLEPAVASFNEASVGIRLDGNSMEFSGEQQRAEAIAKADEKAAEVCSRGPNRKAEFASSRRIPTGQYTYEVERLYLCLR